jgi:hypothetical protein
MIFRSSGHRQKLFLVRRKAGRNTSMMGINRSIVSCRTFLFFLVLLGTPVAGRCDALEDSARELAHKIDAVLTAQGDISCEIRNISSLELEDVVRIEQALKAELHGRCLRTQANGSETANIVVTLSENLKNLLWTAEIHQESEHREILQVVLRSTAFPSPAKTLPIILTGERFWEGPEHILDAGFMSASNGDRLLVLLIPDAILIRNVTKNSESRIDISLAIPAATLREPTGTLSQQVGNFIAAQHDRRNCTVSIDTYALIKCEDYQGETIGFGGPPVKGGQVVPASTDCATGKAIPWFVTGTGDDTQPDYLEVMVWQNLGSAIASNKLTFPGPILAIHGALSDTSDTIVVKNLSTGNYEAYRLSISCRQ